MSEFDPHGLSDDEHPDVSPTAGGAWAALAQAAKSALDDVEPFELDNTAVPGLVVRFKYVNLRTAARNAEKLAKIKDQLTLNVQSSLETLVVACDEICVRTDDGVQPLAGDEEMPVRFDRRLQAGIEGINAQLGLGIEFPENASAREIARAVWGNNDMAVIRAAEAVSEWLSDARTAVVGSASGK